MLRMLERGSKGWPEWLSKDLTRQAVTDLAKETTREATSRFRGSVRMSTGRFWTDAEYEKRRRKVLNTPLP